MKEEDQENKKNNFFFRLKIYYFSSLLLFTLFLVFYLLNLRFSESFSTDLFTILFVISFPLILSVAVYPITNNKYDNWIDITINEQIDKIKKIIIKMFKQKYRNIVKERIGDNKDDVNTSVKTVMNVFHYYLRFSAIVLMFIIMILSYLLFNSKVKINKEVTTIITMMNIILFSFILLFCLKYHLKILLKYSIYLFFKKDGLVFIFNKFKYLIKKFIIPAVENKIIKDLQEEEW